MTHLQALYDAVKAGTAKTVLDFMVLDWAGTPPKMTAMNGAMVGGATALAWLAYRSDDTQAAIDFVQAVLPGWVIGNMGQATVSDDGLWMTSPEWHCWIVAPDYLETCEQAHSTGDGPARALILAALAGMIAKETT